jgi:transcription elongation factor Elf1
VIYDCPQCGKSAIRIEMDRDMEVAKVYCGACKISKDIKINPLYDAVDAFGDFVDQYHKEGA